MIYIDEPFQAKLPTTVKSKLAGKIVLNAHLFSDILGIKGTKELLDFGRLIGLKKEWLQKRGTTREHFDCMNTRIKRAISRGAKSISNKEYVEILILKGDAVAIKMYENRKGLKNDSK